MEPWRLLRGYDVSPTLAMGLDEALLRNTSAPPTLRLYSWRPDTLSLGYFQARASVPAAQRASALVRRITGGGAIHHAAELTFSIAVAADHPLYAGPVADSYRRIHASIVDALLGLGLPARLREAERLASDRAGTGMCFHRSTALDIVWGGRKGVGSAQRRTSGRILHHGSIKLGDSPLEGSIATVSECGRSLGCEEMGELLADAMATRLGLDWSEAPPEPGELSAAAELGRRYVDPAFLDRR